MKPVDEIAWHIETARVIAVKLLRERARQILREHENLGEFVMAMGTAMFTVKGPGIPLSVGDRRYFKPVLDVLDKYDSILHLTGEPMRFTADGPIVTDW